MKKSRIIFTIAALALHAFRTTPAADNFFITTRPTSDPAPAVFTYNGETRVYCYTTQDKSTVTGKPYPIDTIRCYSSDDMFHWRDEGVVLDERIMPDWIFPEGHALWAPHVVYLKGLYRLYAPEATTAEGDKSSYCFMATARAPTGPFQPAPSYISGTGIGAIDPFCFIDTTADSVRVYLLYRNAQSQTAIARMNDSGSVIVGTPWVPSGIDTGYSEGAWLFKNSGMYYLLYATKPPQSTEVIAYATAPATEPGGITPATVWTARGRIIGPTTNWTNHTGVCRFTPRGEEKPRWYIFWHGVSDLGPKLFSLGEGRCSAIEYLTFTNDTQPRIGPVVKTHRGVGTNNAITDTIQIDRYSDAVNCLLRAFPSPGTSTEAPGWFLGIDDSGLATYNDILFPSTSNDTSITGVVARVASTVTNGVLEIRLDSAAGPLLSTITIPATGGTTSWQTTTVTPLTALPPPGVHNLIVHAPTGKYYCNWIKFVSSPAASAPKQSQSGAHRLTLSRPTHNSFTVSGGTSAIRITLLNLHGQKLSDCYTIAAAGEMLQINLNRENRLNAGLYILAVERECNLVVQPFLY